MIFLDVDGVICNWTRGFADLAKIPESKFPVGGNLEFDWSNGAVSPRSIWSYRMDQFYWADLPAYPYVDSFVRIIEKYDPDFRFLTAAPTSPVDHTAFCAGRSRWIYKTLGEKYVKKLVISTSNKSFCARGNILIDDKLRNTTGFTNEGGASFLWKEINGLIWTHASVDTFERQFEKLLSFLEDKK